MFEKFNYNKRCFKMCDFNLWYICSYWPRCGYSLSVSWDPLETPQAQMSLPTKAPKFLNKAPMWPLSPTRWKLHLKPWFLCISGCGGTQSAGCYLLLCASGRVLSYLESKQVMQQSIWINCVVNQVLPMWTYYYIGNWRLPSVVSSADSISPVLQICLWSSKEGKGLASVLKHLNSNI